MRGVGMWSGRRSLIMSLLCCVIGLIGSPAVVLGEGLSTTGPTDSLTSSPLVVSGSPTESEQLGAQEQAKLTNPEMVAIREESRTKFENLSSEQAANVVGEAFPAVVSEQDGGPPPLAPGEKALGFKSANVEQVETGSGDVGVVQSTVPMAVASGGGHLEAVNLALRETGGGFEAQNPLVPVRIPRHLAEGAQSLIAGVSLTPVDEHGVPLEGSEGVADGTGVFFGNTQKDADTVLKPSSTGLEASTVLRSVESPGSLYYRVGMPQGARLIASSSGPDAAEVMDEGVAIATFKPPAATDAAGTLVPVSMSVSGDTLVLSVKRMEGSYQYPILVDPELSGYWQAWSNVVAGNWEFHEWIGYKYEIAGAELRMKHEPGSFANNDYAIWSEKTKGYTKIWNVYVKDELYPWSAPEGKRNTPKWLRAYIEVYKPGGGTEGSLELSGSPYRSEGTVCGAAGCAAAGADAEGNAFSFALTTKEAGSTGEQFYAHAEQVSTGIAQEHGKHSTVQYNTTLPEVEIEPAVKTPNVLYGGGGWIGPHSGGLEFTAEDGGLGVSESWGEVNGSGGWEKVQDTNFLPSGSCAGIQCNSKEQEVLSYKSLTNNGAKPLPEPEAHIRVSGKSYMPYSSSNEHGEGETTLKVDAKPPHNIVLSGLGAKGTEGKELELGEAEGHFKVEAADGEGSTASSGIKHVDVAIDGHEIGKPAGPCTVAKGECAVSGEWSVNGAELGTGTHVLMVAVFDNADNLATKEYELTVYHASPVAIGPGSVNPESGDFALESTDVDLSGGMGSLSVVRHYDSRNTKEGEVGPLGPQWTIGLGSLAQLEVLPDNSVMVIGPDGLTHFSLKEGGGFEAPEGDKNLTLEYNATAHAYLLKNPAQGTTTEFTQPEGAEIYMPTASKGPVATDTITDEYKTVEIGEGKKIVEPILELAPHPTATCARKELEELALTAKSCRALELKYYEETTATGEAKSEWGGYKNRLKEVVAIAYNRSTGKMTKSPSAKYEYDKRGRLRAEWNPEISPALKTTYGYDSEDHVTAVTSAGYQPWLLHDGALAGDSNTGRLLATVRPSAGTAQWNGGTLANTAVPTLSSTTPVIGTTISVSSNGTWSNGALTYAYQWEDCTLSGGSGCTPIVGATNQSYTPQASDAGYLLMAQVTAENAGGAQTANTATSAAIPMPVPVFSSAFGFGVSNGESKNETCSSSCLVGLAGSGSGEYKEPNGVAVDLENNIWVADTKNNRVEKLSSAGTFIGAYSPDAMLEPRAVAVSPITGNVYVTNSGRGRIDVLSPSGTLIQTFAEAGSGPNQLNSPGGLTFDHFGNVFVADTNNNRIVQFSSSGVYMQTFGSAGSGNGQFNFPTSVAMCAGYLYVVDNSNNRVQKFSTEGSYEGQFGKSGTGNGEFSSPSRIACEPVGNDLYVTDKGNNRVQEFSATGTFLDKFGSAGQAAGQFSTPIGVAVGAAGVLYVADSANNRIDKWTPTYSTANPVPAPPSVATTSVSTIEYGVAVSGSGAPHEMGSKEVEGWAQKDDPVEAAAIFPPDEPMGWPASKYKRATIYYMDSQARTVNVASPSGGIATTEYNDSNDVMRTLSADNRAAALKEGSKSAEVAKKLDTESKYNGEGTEEVAEPGTRLLETLGPEHKVKLSNGTEASARSHAQYSYDEGAPEGEVYDLPTKETEGALLTNGEEKDQRTTVTSYNGQGGLGWKLRKATSVTTDPTGLHLTHSTIYEEHENAKKEIESTGNVVETKSPEASASQVIEYPLPSSSHPFGITMGPDNNLAFTNSGTGKVGRITASGSVTEYAAEKDEPEGITSGPDEKYWFVGHSIRHVSHMTLSGALTVYTLTRTGTSNVGITSGPDENLWFTESATGYIGKINTKDEVLGEYALPAGSKPNDITVGPDKNLWYTNYGTNTIGKITTSGTITEYALPAGSQPYWITVGPDKNLWYTNSGTNKIGKITTSGTVTEYSLPAGSQPRGITSGPDKNLWYTNYGTNKIGKITTSGTINEYSLPSGSEPQGIVTGPDNRLWFTDYGTNKIGALNPNAGETHTTRTVYYSANGEATVAECREHPEWVNLPCRTEPVAQPGNGINLPVTTISYNMWEQAETTTEAFGATIRTKKTTFDGAGRPLTTEETSSNDIPLPKVTDKYNTSTGALEKESTTVGETTKTITSARNTLGQLTSYTDADGNTTTDEYEPEGDDRLEAVKDGKGTQTYSYDTTTGLMTKLVDSAAGTFSAGYDVEDKMLTETYPNGMTATNTLNSLGQVTSIEYVKTTHCSSSCTWFSDFATPSIHGETLSQTSTLSQENYVDDNAGRLTETQETPAGKGCTTRLYNYDEESDRTSLTTREPGIEGKCAAEGGNTERHSYDEANRLADESIAYEPFGNTATLPAADAGGGTDLNSTYYVDNQVATETQGGKTLEYFYDPAGRTRETKTVAGGKTTSTDISHYAGPREALSWTSESSEGSETWSRNIPGIDGGLDAIQTSSGSVVLQLHDLKGNIVATAGLSETETKLLSTYNSTEFGVPNEGKAPPKYAWFGADGIASSELPSGTVAQDGVTYVPLTGRPLQTQPIELPLPIKYYNPYEKPNAEGATWGPIAAGLRLAESSAAEAAVGGGERHALEVSEELGGGCSGDSACASSNLNCSLHMRFGEPYSNELWAVARFNCNRKVPYFQLEVCVLVENPETGRFANLKDDPCNHEGKQQGQIFKNVNTWQAWVKTSCATGLNYRAWEWGRAYGGFYYASPGKETGSLPCEGRGSADTFYEIIDYVRD
jgi:streptogramin lyase